MAQERLGWLATALAVGPLLLAACADGDADAVQTLVTDGVIRLAGDYTQAEAEGLAERIAP